VAPYRESHHVEQTPDRGACRWCRTEIAVPTAHSFECTKCGAQLGADDARALLPRLLAERQAAMTDDANRAAADRQVELAISFVRAVFVVIAAAVLFASRVWSHVK
jgi:hypothetical protein